MKELEVELEQLRLLVVAVVGREQVGCGSGGKGAGGLWQWWEGSRWVAPVVLVEGQ